MSKHEAVYRSVQLNPNNNAYWTSRGYNQRPEDWNERLGRLEIDKERHRSLIRS